MTLRTHDEIAKKIGVDRSTISRIFSPDPGVQRDPSLKTLRSLAEAFGVGIDEAADFIALKRQSANPRPTRLA